MVEKPGAELHDLSYKYLTFLVFFADDDSMKTRKVMALAGYVRGVVYHQ